MIKFYFNTAPNPMKVALLLEELELPYEAIPIDTRKGEQFTAEYLEINPNGKMPAIVDGDARLRQQCDPALPCRQDRPVRPAAIGCRGSRRNALLADVRSQRPRAILRPVGPLPPSAPEPKAYALNRYDYEAQPALEASSTSAWPAAAACSATPMASSTWPCGAGRG